MKDGACIKGFHTDDGLNVLPTTNMQIIKTKDLPGGAYEATIIYNGERFRDKSIIPNMTFNQTIELAFGLTRKIDFKNPPIDPKSGKIKQQFISPSGLIVEMFIHPKTYTIETMYPIEKLD